MKKTIKQQHFIPKNQAEQFMKSKGFKYPIKIAIYKWNQDADAAAPINEYSLSELLEQYHEARMKEELKKYYLWIDENYAMGMLCGNANAVVEEYLDKTNKGKGENLKEYPQLNTY